MLFQSMDATWRAQGGVLAPFGSLLFSNKSLLLLLSRLPRAEPWANRNSELQCETKSQLSNSLETLGGAANMFSLPKRWLSQWRPGSFAHAQMHSGRQAKTVLLLLLLVQLWDQFISIFKHVVRNRVLDKVWRTSRNWSCSFMQFEVLSFK